MRICLPLLAVVLGACGSPSDSSDNTGSGDAWVQGVVSHTILAFARFTQFPPLQVVDLRERPSL